jgi:hypothetical protein
MRKRLFRWALWVAAAFVVHVLAGRELAGEDVIAVVLDVYHHRHDETLLFLAALVAARGFLYFLAPGWALYIVVTGLIQRYREYVEKHGPLDLI